MPRGTPLDYSINDLYGCGLSDQGIADHLGAHKKSIARWRTVQGLPSNVKQGRPKKRGKIAC